MISRIDSLPGQYLIVAIQHIFQVGPATSRVFKNEGLVSSQTPASGQNKTRRTRLDLCMNRNYISDVGVYDLWSNRLT